VNSKNTTEAVEGLQPWRDENGNLNLDVLQSGNYDICDDKAARAALIEQARADRELLHAVLSALDLPRPAQHIDWQRARRELAEQRAKDVRIGLDGYLNGTAPADTTVDWVRQSVVDYPVSYEVEGGAR